MGSRAKRRPPNVVMVARKFVISQARLGSTCVFCFAKEKRTKLPNAHMRIGTVSEGAKNYSFSRRTGFNVILYSLCDNRRDAMQSPKNDIDVKLGGWTSQHDAGSGFCVCLCFMRQPSRCDAKSEE